MEEANQALKDLKHYQKNLGSAERFEYLDRVLTMEEHIGIVLDIRWRIPCATRLDQVHSTL